MAEITDRLTRMAAKFKRLDDASLIERVAQALASEKAIGWFQGRMEFGPRSLGNRSILGDARSPSMQRTLNLKIKYRESFCPFAPTVLREDVADWFDLDCDSPYMLLVADVHEKRQRAMNDNEKKLFGIDKLNIVRSEIPAVTHVDYSARVQTVDRAINPRYHALLTRFKELTAALYSPTPASMCAANPLSVRPRMRFAVLWEPNSICSRSAITC